MSRLTRIHIEVTDLTADELHQLAVWLFKRKLIYSDNETELRQKLPVSNPNSLIPELFQGTLIIGVSESGKSSHINKLLGNQP